VTFGCVLLTMGRRPDDLPGVRERLVFITATMARVPLASVFREITPFTLIMLLVVLLLTYVPFLSLWLPNLIGKF